MRPTILVLIAGVNLLMAGGSGGSWALAAEEASGITQVMIETSGGPVDYTDQLQREPPAILIEFHSPNVKVQLDPLVAIDSGIVREIQSDYYPSELNAQALKRLTLRLTQPASYTVAQVPNQILIDIETPRSLMPRPRKLGMGVMMRGIEGQQALIERLQAMESALQQASPQLAQEPLMREPLVVTKPVEISKPVLVTRPAPESWPVPRKGGGFWFGLMMGAISTWALVAWRRRKAPQIIAQPPQEIPELPPVAEALQPPPSQTELDQAHTQIATLEQELGAQVKLNQKIKVEREAWEKEANTNKTQRQKSERALAEERARTQQLAQQLIRLQADLAEKEQAQARLLDECQQLQTKMAEVIRAEPTQRLDLEKQLAQSQTLLSASAEQLERKTQEVEQLKRQWQESEWYLGEERTKIAGLEHRLVQVQQQLEELNRARASDAEGASALHARLDQERQEREQVKIHWEESEWYLGEERAKTQQLKSEVEQLTQALASQEAAAKAPWQGQERRKWARCDLSRRKTKGISFRAASQTGEPIDGKALDISTGGMCVALPSGETLSDEFEMKLLFPNRSTPIETRGRRIWKAKGRRQDVACLGVAFQGDNEARREALSQFFETKAS